MDISEQIMPRLTHLQKCVHSKPYNVLHVPSFLLGCFVVIMISSLQPLFRSILGSVLIGVLRIIKYSVIGGGVGLIIMVLTSDQSKQPTKARQSKHHEGDFQPIGINTLQTKVNKHSRPTQAPEPVTVTSAAYETFIKRAE